MKYIYLPFIVCSFLTTLFAAEKPNVLIIVSDDHGYSDVGFHGCKDIPTPHLDRLAKEGLLCTNGYVSHPFCSPTRAGLMTGRYQHRFGHQNNPFYNPNDHKEGLPMSEKILPEYLTKAGYVTGWIGKWHLGAAPEFRPENRGFAETFGFIGGGHKYQNWTTNIKNEYTVPIERNGKSIEVKEHLTTAFGNEAADYIKRHQGNPWFLYLAFNAPHTPHEPTAERLARFASIKNPLRRNYAAQISLMDDAIGAALDSLRDSGQEKNTLVFFFSDNGGPLGGGSNGSINDPLRGGKGDVYDGGVRVPFLVKWPAEFPAGIKYDFPVCSLDVFASTLAVADVAMPSDKKYDSVNLIPFLSGENKTAPHQQLFWARSPNMAVREGDTKLVKMGPDLLSLYDLKADIGEKTDIQNQQADKTKHLNDLLTAWNAEMVPPAFTGIKSAAKKPAQEKK